MPKLYQRVTGPLAQSPGTVIYRGEKRVEAVALELFDYDAPDQKTVQPRNSDIGGHHIAVYVDDIQAAADYFKAKGIRTLMGPLPVSEGPAAGQTILYFFAPWGLQMEAISFPQGMAYEKDGGTVLWSNTDPAK